MKSTQPTDPVRCQQRHRRAARRSLREDDLQHQAEGLDSYRRRGGPISQWLLSKDFAPHDRRAILRKLKHATEDVAAKRGDLTGPVLPAQEILSGLLDSIAVAMDAQRVRS